MELSEVDSAVIELLAVVTREKFTYTGNAQHRELVNESGVDLHIAEVREVNLGPDKTAIPYMVFWPEGGADRYTRLAGGRSLSRYGFQLTIAAGSFMGCRWAMDKVCPLLSRARLLQTSGLLIQYFDQVPILKDDQASPPRWYATPRYVTSIH